MSYPIPSNINMNIFIETVGLKLRPIPTIQIDYSDESGTIPTAISFIPDLSPQEQIILNQILSFCLSLNDFENLPNWATWTADEAETNITNAIFNGQDAVTIKTNINTQLINITTANVSQINSRLDVIRTLFGNAVDAIIAIRTILVAIGRAIIYLRNLVIKIR